MELIVVLVIALLVLGPKKLPEVGRSVGRGIREFKASISGHDENDEPHAALIAHADDDVHPSTHRVADDELVAVPAGRS
jgi:sec-independent protein translocase protein TatA